MKNKKNIITIFVALILFISCNLLLDASNIKFVIPESESVNGKIFLLQDKNIKNDYVVFEYNKLDYKGYHQGKLFIKKMGCDSGQHLLVTKDKVLCDGKFIATILEKNGEGKTLPHYEYNGTIPNDSFFALGEHPRSFDSRYFGLVDKKQIKNTARRIF
ncbi:MAG: S26 family signal peptidase [Arcobacteraceae bacterium]|jgi:signal peptidase I|nr:S26 family signal peptidase [Arcobacteraceae bacterium]